MVFLLSAGCAGLIIPANWRDQPPPCLIARASAGLGCDPSLLTVEIRVLARVEKTIQADADLLTRAVENIFDNALRYTPAGGRIEVAVEESGQAVNLRIGNTGVPIPVEFRTAIFDKYNQSASASGRLNMGLGLYFCRLATEAHGGRIWVEQTEALPTVFVIQLPA